MHFFLRVHKNGYLGAVHKEFTSIFSKIKFNCVSTALYIPTRQILAYFKHLKFNFDQKYCLWTLSMLDPQTEIISIECYGLLKAGLD
jgi:hypothetical protein